MSQWNERYSIDEYYYGTEPNEFLKAHASRIPTHGKVLCLAEGEGRNAVYLASLGYQVTAVDGSKVGLEKLQKLAKLRGVSVEAVVADLAEYTIEPGTWDAIVSIWCHVPKTLRESLHLNSVRGLKTGGVFALESYHPRQLEFKSGGPPSAELMMTSDALREELEGLDFEVLREIDREVKEGPGHQGRSAVVQALAVKKG
jgi:SAM-dependent methyltransferase